MTTDSIIASLSPAVTRNPRLLIWFRCQASPSQETSKRSASSGSVLGKSVRAGNLAEGQDPIAHGQHGPEHQAVGGDRQRETVERGGRKGHDASENAEQEGKLGPAGCGRTASAQVVDEEEKNGDQRSGGRDAHFNAVLQVVVVRVVNVERR